MIFSSYRFIFIFLPAALILYAATRRFSGLSLQKWALVGTSLVFYGYAGTRFVPLLAGTIVFNYLVLLLMTTGVGKTRRTFALILAFAENLGLLFYFKYSNFFLQNVNRLLGTDYFLENIVLPIGISFFTFQILAYIVDVYRGQAERGSFLDFAVFVTFFPQLVVGPIMRYNDFSNQLRTPDFTSPPRDEIMLGIYLFSIGCAKKILIADPLITHAQAFYGGAAGGFFDAWSAVLAYTFAYYFDFSGYIDMALGLGRFFGIKLPHNFNSPYKALDFADFWRRWNMTVSQFFSDYIFKSIFKFGDRIPKLILATLLTFLVSGVWHGAGWHYIFWGLFNGVLVCISNIMTLKRIKPPRALSWAATFFFVLMARVLFDSSGMTQALKIYKTLFDLRPFLSGALSFPRGALAFLSANAYPTALIAVSAAICFFTPNTGEISRGFVPGRRHAVVSAGLLAASLFFMGAVSNFLYFQF